MQRVAGLRPAAKVIYAINNYRPTASTRPYGPARRFAQLLYEPGRDRGRGVPVRLDRGPIPKGSEIPAFNEHNHYK